MTLKLSKLINSYFVFFWTEDHICLQNKIKFNSIIAEMKKNKIDYLQYSWFINGLGVKSLEGIKYKETSN